MNVVLGLLKTLKKHVIGLVFGANLPNLLRYRGNPTKHAELKKQVDRKLSSAEVTENTFVNRTIDKSPHD